MKILILLVLLVGCSDYQYNVLGLNTEEEELSSIIFVLDNEVDENGFLHIPTNPSVYQTLYRIKGYVYRDGESVNVVKFGWWSEYHWDYDGFLIPIVNGSSYSREDGEVNTMVGVVPSMIGDTIVIHYGYYDEWKSETTYGEINVIID